MQFKIKLLIPHFIETMLEKKFTDYNHNKSAGIRRDFKCKTEKSHFKIKFYSLRMQTILNSFIHSTVYQDKLKKDNTIPENPTFKQLNCLFLAEGAESNIK